MIAHEQMIAWTCVQRPEGASGSARSLLATSWLVPGRGSGYAGASRGIPLGISVTDLEIEEAIREAWAILYAGSAASPSARRLAAALLAVTGGTQAHPHWVTPDDLWRDRLAVLADQGAWLAAGVPGRESRTAGCPLPCCRKAKRGARTPMPCGARRCRPARMSPARAKPPASHNRDPGAGMTPNKPALSARGPGGANRAHPNPMTSRIEWARTAACCGSGTGALTAQGAVLVRGSGGCLGYTFLAHRARVRRRSARRSPASSPCRTWIPMCSSAAARPALHHTAPAPGLAPPRQRAIARLAEGRAPPWFSGSVLASSPSSRPDDSNPSLRRTPPSRNGAVRQRERRHAERAHRAPATWRTRALSSSPGRLPTTRPAWSGAAARPTRRGSPHRRPRCCGWTCPSRCKSSRAVLSRGFCQISGQLADSAISG